MSRDDRLARAALICRGCGWTLGSTDDRLLHIGGAVCSRPVTLSCGRCGAPRVWRPAPRKGEDDGGHGDPHGG